MDNMPMNRRRPDAYEGIVTQQEYEIILDHSLNALAKIGIVRSVDAGTIILQEHESSEEHLHCHLDNLVRRCKAYTKDTWQRIIAQHFEKFPINKPKQIYMFKDFDFARDLLRVQVRAWDMIPADLLEKLIYRKNIPHTYTFLVLDYDGKMQYIRHEDIVEWETDIDELFAIGLKNLAKEDISIETCRWDEEDENKCGYVVLHNDYAASFALEIERNAYLAVGEYGTLLSIPTKSAALLHPLNSNTVLEFIHAFWDLQQMFYHENETPVSEYFYWYYRGHFFEFAQTITNDEITIGYPPQLAAVMLGIDGAEDDDDDE